MSVIANAEALADELLEKISQMVGEDVEDYAQVEVLSETLVGIGSFIKLTCEGLRAGFGTPNSGSSDLRLAAQVAEMQCKIDRLHDELKRQKERI
ncbi:MAG: hypothetical protein Fues2KO_52010 [Fuerstiella sp.]